MADFFYDLAAPALLEVNRANLYDWYCYLGRSPAAELNEGAGFTALLSGLAYADLNAVFRARLAGDDAEQVIAAAMQHFAASGVHDLLWWVEPDTPPAALEILKSYGFFYDEAPALAIDLSILPEEDATPAGLSIVPVLDRETMRQWAHAGCIGFKMPAEAESRVADLFAGVGFELPFRSYLARLDGRPVATSQLYLSAGIAGIYSVSTVPEARRQGIGRAITLAPLRQARELGYRVATLQASTMGYPVYRRMGFVESGKLGVYVKESARPPVA